MSTQTTTRPPAPTVVDVVQAVSQALKGWRHVRKSYGGEWDYTCRDGRHYTVTLSADRAELEVQGPSIDTPEGWTTVQFAGCLDNASDHTVTLDGLRDLLSTLGVPEAGE
jgi:hypothetical protein